MTPSAFSALDFRVVELVKVPYGRGFLTKSATANPNFNRRQSTSSTVLSPVNSIQVGQFAEQRGCVGACWQLKAQDQR